MNDKRDYRSISGIGQLRDARVELENEISKKELMINFKYDELKQSLTLTALMGSLAVKISMVIPYVRSFLLILLPFMKIFKSTYEYVAEQLTNKRQTTEDDTSPEEEKKDHKKEDNTPDNDKNQ